VIRAVHPRTIFFAPYNHSGSQFAIAGLVDESAPSGVCRDVCYIAFRDGIAVHLLTLNNFPDAIRLATRSLKTFDNGNPDHVKWALEADFAEPGYYALPRHNRDAVSVYAAVCLNACSSPSCGRGPVISGLSR